MKDIKNNEFIIEENRIYVEDKNGKVIAEIDFEKENDTYIITHTFVDSEYRGQKLASKLVEATVKEITEVRKSKIKATCSYARTWIEKNYK